MKTKALNPSLKPIAAGWAAPELFVKHEKIGVSRVLVAVAFFIGFLILVATGKNA